MDQAGTYWRGRFVGFVRRWVLPVIAAGALGVLAAFLVSRAMVPEYRATAQLYLTPAAGSGAFQDVAVGQSLARTYAQLVTAEIVLRAAMSSVGWDGEIERFRARTQASQVRDTSIINVSFRDPDPERAADAANAIAQAFIDQSRTLEASLQGTTASQLDEQIGSVQADIQALDEQIARLRASVAASAPPGQPTARPDQQAQLLTLDGLRQSKQQTLAQLVRARDDIRLTAARSRNALTLWQAATPPRRPDSPNVVLTVALGGLAGALFALVAIGIVRYRDDRLSDADALAERLGTVAIGEIRLGARPRSLAGKLFVRDAPDSLEAEAFRSLRTSISFANPDGHPRTLLVTSAVPLEGKSVVSANLALVFADAGTPTILVDADLRRPSQHDLFGIKASPGLTDLLAGDAPSDAILEMRVRPNLIVIPAGPPPSTPAELASSGRMYAFLQYLRELSKDGVVILDASPLLTVTDAAALATKVDGCLMVVDSSRTGARVARRATEILQQVHAPVLGIVLNKVTAREAGYGYYRYPAAKSGKTGRTNVSAS